MRRPIRMLVGIVTAVVLFGGLVPAATAEPKPVPGSTQVTIVPEPCVATDETYADWQAMDFISVCRKASIRRVFPGEYYYTTLAEIRRAKSAKGKKAWKLLNDNRFKK